jgi:hypothetical protein
MPHPPTGTYSEALKKYLAQMAELLHLLDTVGWDHPDTNKLADQMDDPWYNTLTEEERTIINAYVNNYPDIGDRIP